jgi:hypothetical protein
MQNLSLRRPSIDLEGFQLDGDGMDSYPELIQLLEKFSDDLFIFCEALVKQILQTRATSSQDDTDIMNWCCLCLNRALREVVEQEQFSSISKFESFVLEARVSRSTSTVEAYANPPERSIPKATWLTVMREDSPISQKFREKYGLKSNFIFDQIAIKLSVTCGFFLLSRLRKNVAKKFASSFDAFVNAVYHYSNLDSVIELYGHLLLALTNGCSLENATNELSISNLRISRKSHDSAGAFYEMSMDDISSASSSKSIELHTYLVDYAERCGRYIRNCNSLSKINDSLRLIVPICENNIASSVSSQVRFPPSSNIHLILIGHRWLRL